MLAVCVVGLAVGGCSSQPTYEFDELDLTPAQDELVEFSLGSYAVPIPVDRSYGEDASGTRRRTEFNFELYALITHDYESRLSDLWERDNGKICDRIIRICRSASLEDLQDPELATLKSRLTDALQAQLGPRSIRRLMITEPETKEL